MTEGENHPLGWRRIDGCGVTFRGMGGDAAASSVRANPLRRFATTCDIGDAPTGDVVTAPLGALEPVPRWYWRRSDFLRRDGGRRPNPGTGTYAFPVGNIGKEVRRIEVLPVPEPTPEPASPERPEPQREPAPTR